jgi:DNA-binding ferritin-like protein
MIEQLISRVFYARNAAHAAHWQTSSFAQHMALGSFYDDVIEQLDTLVEAHMGVFGKVKDIPVTSGAYPDIAGLLTQDVRWIKANASEITKDVSALQNLLDNISETYLSTLYKLKNLS